MASNKILTHDAAETEGVWVTAEATVAMTDEYTISQIKARSHNEARRLAVEKAVGLFVKGSTVVYNYVLAEDLVQTVARGHIVEEHIVEEGVRETVHKSGTKALVYETKLKAKVRKVAVNHAAQFDVQAKLNKTVFQSKEEMQIQVRASRDAYLYIFSVGQDNAVTLLYPNRFAQESFVTAGQELIFPDDKLRSMGIVLRVMTPPNTAKALERIKFIAATRRLDFLKSGFQEGIFQTYDSTDTRLMADLLRVLSTLDESEWAEATLAYEVQR